MAFDKESKKASATSADERDEFGCTEDDYLGMMNDMSTAIVDGRDEVRPAPRVSRRDRRPGSSNNASASGRRHRGVVQQESRTNQPGGSSYGAGNPSSHSSSRYHPYNSYQQIDPPVATAAYGTAYSNPSVRWQSGPETQLQIYQSSSLGNHEGGYTTTLSSQPDFSNIQSQDPGHRLPLSSQQDSASFPSQMPRYTPSPFTLDEPSNSPSLGPMQHGNSNWIRNPADSTTAQRFAATSIAPSPYAASVPGSTTYSLPHSDAQTEGAKKTKEASKTKDKARRGLTRTTVNGELEWQASSDSDWIPAVRHDTIRPQLIALAEAERLTLGLQNEHPDEPGPGQYNVTSFFREHVPWGPDRDSRPDILFDWQEDRVNNPRPANPGHMYFEEDGTKCIVLDPHDDPVRDWDIPATIASNIPGYKLEAMRRSNMSLRHKDLWARMPSRINMGSQTRPNCVELGEPNSSINMPMERFRFHAGLCSWTDRGNSSKIRAGLGKLYGDKLRNNSIRAFGRDISKREMEEAKKGESAVFQNQDHDAVEARKARGGRKSTGTTRQTKPTSSTRGAKAQSHKRKRSEDDEDEPSLEALEDCLPPVRSNKRARHEAKEYSIATEVDDLGMFEQSPTAIDRDGATRRYPRRSTHKDAKATRRTISIDELSYEGSADVNHANVPDNHGTPKKTRKVAQGRPTSKRTESLTSESSAEEGDDIIATGIEEDDEAHSDTEGVELAEPDSSVGISEPAHPVGGFDTRLQRQPQDAVVAHPFDEMMRQPWAERSPEEEDTPLQAHRKWVKDFLGDEEAAAMAPASWEHVRTEQPVSPSPGLTTNRALNDPRLQAILPHSNPTTTAPQGTYAQSSRTREQRLDDEWAQVFEPMFLDLGFRSVNYSEVPPWNDSEVQSLIDALLPTREVYFAWTGEPAPRTDPQHSYRAQFDTIFEAFQDWWNQHRSNEPLPILTGVMHGGQSLYDWQAPCKDSIYYEGFREGHRAPRGEDGKALDLPRPWLEDAFRKGC